VQRLQFFLSESRWDPDRVNARRLELLRADPPTAPHAGGVLVIDDSGDRKDGAKTAHVGRQWLGRYGKTDNGVVTVTTVWADERVYYPEVPGSPSLPAATECSQENLGVSPGVPGCTLLGCGHAGAADGDARGQDQELAHR
jgi:hypothetical protein